MSRDFDKADFQKGAEKEICNHCGTEEGTFTLIKDKLIEVDTDQYNHGRHASLTSRRNPGINSLIEKLQRNIFSSIDKIGEDHISGLKGWTNRLKQSSREPNEGLLEVMHFLGDKTQYNTLLLSLPPIWNKQLNDFYKKAYKGSPRLDPKKYTENFNAYLKHGRDIRANIHNPEWFTDMSKEEAIPFIHGMIKANISGGHHSGFVGEEIDKIAKSIYTSLSERGVKKFGNWEENYANNSPLSVLAPKLLSNQFKKEEVFEGVKYCDYCGAEQSRSLMYSGLFIPFHGEEKEVVKYFGRIQDIEAEVLPIIQDLWEEQGEEFKRRDKKANKMWDSAEDRLKKKQEDEKERKRQAEIAKLEKKLRAIKNNDE